MKKDFTNYEEFVKQKEKGWKKDGIIKAGQELNHLLPEKEQPPHEMLLGDYDSSVDPKSERSLWNTSLDSGKVKGDYDSSVDPKSERSLWNTSLDSGKVKVYSYSDSDEPRSYADYSPSSLQNRSKVKKKIGASNKISEEIAFLEPTLIPEGLREESQGLLPELESKDANIPSDKEMFDDIRDSLLIFRVHDRTIVYAVAIDKQGENEISALRCFGGVAFGCYPYDMGRDAYLVGCVGYVSVGSVPFAICVGEGKVKIPIPDRILEKSFTPNQKKIMQVFKEKYSSDKYEIKLLQMLGAN
jgi:hypothetical protein